MTNDLVSLKILTTLLKDGRATHQSISEEFNFSRPAIHRRISKLEECGIIKGYNADVSFHKIGLTIDVFILVNIHTFNYNEVIKQIMNLSGKGIYVQEVFRITGGKCILIRLKASSSDRLRQFHDEMLTLEGFVETNTMLVLQSEKNDFKYNYVVDDSKV